MGKQNLKKHYNSLIVGGGIVGAGLFRDLALHGISTLLIDQGDFAAQTSSASSKMLHGGVRYLENLDFHLVYEALHEKNLWLKLTPHLCYEEPFHMPIYQESKYPLWTYALGLSLYDFLSLYKNSPHKIYGREKVLSEIPGLKSEGLSGAGVYYDAIVDDTKMALECIYDGLLEESAEARTYTKLTNFKKVGELYYCELTDQLTREVFQVTTDHLVFCTGPFTDILMKEIGFNWKSVLAPSKGAHLWLKEDALKVSHPILLQTKDDRVVFVIPRNKAILVGTTENKPDMNFFDIKASKDDILYLLKVLKNFFPETNITEDQILSSYAGVRPLVKENAEQSLAKVSREHKVFTPKKNLHLILGGKYTTFRVMVQGVAERIVTDSRSSYNISKTLAPLRQRSVIPSFGDKKITMEKVKLIMEAEQVRTIEDLMNRRLAIPNANHWRESDTSYDQFLALVQKLF
ncbi:MAG: glycerol-3-phosphate dehydrogenase/oxidase [Bacteriovoracaceae bacterium]